MQQTAWMHGCASGRNLCCICVGVQGMQSNKRCLRLLLAFRLLPFALCLSLAYWRNSVARTNCSILSQFNHHQPSADSILILIFVLVCCSSSSAAAGSSSWWCCSKTLILLWFPTQIRLICTANTRDGAAAHWRVKVCGLFWTFARTKCTKKFIFTVFAETTIQWDQRRLPWKSLPCLGTFSRSDLHYRPVPSLALSISLPVGGILSNT